ncbi:arrestin domain-containing protein 3-like [Lytechinus variegatus]|uniref:arrestin domain-containing protein 3-like n=1 Tax=Lytechinus variegatus TaxID=7654 RepID=UPI001BB1C3EA|nr:arrestin domain-containing protein 3-like [Lytechinus variegatus]
MGIKIFEVLFAGNESVYKPGEILTGEVRIACDKREEIRCIRLNFSGRSLCTWTESEGTGENRETVRYTWDHYFFNEEMIVRGAGKDAPAADRITLDGEHVIPFQFQIPNASLPPPFEGYYGYVRYFVKVTLDRPWKFDQHTEKLFSILTVKDLNYEPDVLVPLSNQVEQTVCCLCCASGPIILKGIIDKRGYVPGEYIFVSVALRNNSSRKINRITVTLQQTSYYIGESYGFGVPRRTKRTFHTKQVAELNLHGCEARGSINYDRKRMLVPPVPPCSFDTCPNISIMYHVKIEAGIRGTMMDASMENIITIGTIPAFPQTRKTLPTPGHGTFPDIPSARGPPQPGGQVRSEYPTPERTGVPLQPEVPLAQTSQNPMMLENDATAPPPSYQTAVEGPHKIERTEGSFSSIIYAPQYPYYNADDLYATMGLSGEASVQEDDHATVVNQPKSIHHPP